MFLYEMFSKTLYQLTLLSIVLVNVRILHTSSMEDNFLLVNYVIFSRG